MLRPCSIAGIAVALACACPWVSSAAAADLAPHLGGTMLLVPINGSVSVKQKGKQSFTRVERRLLVPLGSTVDATRGGVEVVTARDRKRRQRLELSRGRFVVTQPLADLIRQGPPVTTIRLSGGDPNACRGSHALASRSKPPKKGIKRLLQGASHGSHGPMKIPSNGQTTSLLGTRWTTEEHCDGTLTRVDKGTALISQKLVQPQGSSTRSAVRPSASTGPAVSTQVVRDGESFLLRCFDLEQPFTGRTCLKAFVTPPHIALGISTEVYQGAYDLCLVAPGATEKCHSYAFGPQGLFPFIFQGRPVGGRLLRSSLVGCGAAGVGTYRARWKVSGRPVGEPISFEFPSPTPQAPDTASCTLETTLVAGTNVFGLAVPTSPPFRYGASGG
jgi:hypothetical protein